MGVILTIPSLLSVYVIAQYYQKVSVLEATSNKVGPGDRGAVQNMAEEWGK